VKDHGTKKMVEGGDVVGKKVLLVEDHVSTGGSSLAGVDSIRAEAGVVENCLAITKYDFPEASQAFRDAGVSLYTLTTFSVILHVALERDLLSAHEVEAIQDWFRDPSGWAERHGFGVIPGDQGGGK
jgi:orotate phosphoribosyltransferase